ncbi:hypothetical protein [Nocardia sp. NBC_00416]
MSFWEALRPVVPPLLAAPVSPISRGRGTTEWTAAPAERRVEAEAVP